MLSPTAIRFFDVVSFGINQKKIEALFCVNKEKPKLKCSGTCHLKRQLKKTNDAEKQGEIVALKEVMLFFSAPIAFSFCDYVFPSREMLNVRYSFPHTEAQASSCFHPPQHA